MLSIHSIFKALQFDVLLRRILKTPLETQVFERLLLRKPHSNFKKHNINSPLGDKL